MNEEHIMTGIDFDDVFSSIVVTSYVPHSSTQYSHQVSLIIEQCLKNHVYITQGCLCFQTQTQMINRRLWPCPKTSSIGYDCIEEREVGAIRYEVAAYDKPSLLGITRHQPRAAY